MNVIRHYHKRVKCETSLVPILFQRLKHQDSAGFDLKQTATLSRCEGDKIGPNFLGCEPHEWQDNRSEAKAS